MFFTRESFPFPEDLDMALTKALWGGTPSEKDIRHSGRALRALWEELAKHRGFARDDSHYSFRKDMADAYAAYYLPANALKPALVLEEAFLSGCDFLPENSLWLDLGAGPGTAYWGLAWWAVRRGKTFRYVGWEQSPHFTSLAQRLASSTPFPARAEFRLADRKHRKHWLEMARELAPTHVSFMNSAAEIFPDPEARKAAMNEILGVLRAHTARDGKKRFLLVIEPGSRESARELAALKDALSSHAAVLLPCLDERGCGALADPKDWCHEEASCEFPGWLNAIGAEAGLRKEALLFSYALLAADPETVHPLAGAARIVSQRLERKGQVECHLCMKAGKRKARVQRSKAAPETEFFLEASRGDILLGAELGEKGDVEKAGRFVGLESVF